jgi:hypothetical protein
MADLASRQKEMKRRMKQRTVTEPRRTKPKRFYRYRAEKPKETEAEKAAKWNPTVEQLEKALAILFEIGREYHARNPFFRRALDVLEPLVRIR